MAHTSASARDEASGSDMVLAEVTGGREFGLRLRLWERSEQSGKCDGGTR